MTNSVHIAALDYYLPEKVEHNEDLRKDFPGRISPTLIEKIGIKSRHIVENNTTASHLALKAGEKLLAETNFDKSTLNALVYCSIHHDYMTPSTSCLLQDQLGLNTNIASFDITHGCSGYLYGLSLAKSLLLSSPAIENILFLTGSVLTKYVHPENLA